MANTLKFGNGQWATGNGTALAYNDENSNFKPLPFDFTRASSGTTVNQSGLIETVGSGIPRIDFQGNTKGALLLEPSRTNLITYSEDFSNASWIKDFTSIVPNEITSPNGGLNASLITADGADIDHTIYQEPSLTPQTYTFSAFVKKNTQRYVHLAINRLNASTLWVSSVFDLDTLDKADYSNGSGYNDGVSKIENYGNDWYKITLTAYLPDSTVYLAFIGFAENMSAPNISRGRWQFATSNSFYVWGAQLEAGSYPTSYIPTSGSTVTRVIDDIEQTTPNLSNSQEVTAFIDIGARPLTGSNVTGDAIKFQFESGNRIIYNQNGSSNHRIEIDTDVAATKQYFSTNTKSTTPIKIAIAVTQTTIKIRTNTGDLWNASITGVADWSNLNLISTAITQSIGNIKINDLKFYNTALSDSELAALTQV